MNNLELYIGCHKLDNALSGSPPNLLLEASNWVGETDQALPSMWQAMYKTELINSMLMQHIMIMMFSYGDS